MRGLICITTGLLLCSCNGPVAGEKAVGTGSVNGRQAENVAATDVFVMRMPPHDRTVALARFEGAFSIENSCLIFRMGDRRYLPGIADGTAVAIDGQRVRIGARTFALGERVVLSGAQIDVRDLPSSTVRPPPQCDLPILRIV